MKLKQKRLKMTSEECEFCKGNEGVLLMFNTDTDRLEIQRCDNCQVFDSDIKAWEFVKP